MVRERKRKHTDNNPDVILCNMSLVTIKNLCLVTFLGSKFLFYQKKYISTEHTASDKTHFVFIRITVVTKIFSTIKISTLSW